jgi:hypothetical protein
MAFGRQLDSEATRGQLEREGKREREREQELRFIFTEPAAFGPFLGRRRRCLGTLHRLTPRVNLAIDWIGLQGTRV